MSVLSLAGKPIAIVTQVDCRKHFNSLTSDMLSPPYHINVTSGPDVAICSNSRLKILRLLMSCGDHQIECDCKLTDGTYRQLLGDTCDTKQPSCYLVTPKDKALNAQIKKQLAWPKITQVKISLMLDPVDMRKRYDSLSSHVISECMMDVSEGLHWVVCFNSRKTVLRLIGLHDPKKVEQKVELTSKLTQGTYHELLAQYLGNNKQQKQQTQTQKQQKPQEKKKKKCYRRLSLAQLKRLLTG